MADEKQDTVKIIESLDALKKSIDDQTKNDSDYRKNLEQKNSKELKATNDENMSQTDLATKRYDSVVAHLSSLEKNQDVLNVKIDSVDANLNLINLKLSSVVKHLDENQEKVDFQHFTNLSIVFFLFCVIPMFYSIKFLSKILDSASA